MMVCKVVGKMNRVRVVKIGFERFRLRCVLFRPRCRAWIAASKTPAGGVFDTLDRVSGLIRWFKAVVSLNRDFDNRAIPRKDPAEIDS